MLMASISITAPVITTFFWKWNSSCCFCSGSSSFQKSCIFGVTIMKKIRSSIAATGILIPVSIIIEPVSSTPPDVSTAILGSGTSLAPAYSL